MVALLLDYLDHPGGGMGTYLDALARHLQSEGQIPFHVFVAVAPGEQPIVNGLRDLGVPMTVQRRVPGDRFHMQKRLLFLRTVAACRKGDWIFCLKPPHAPLYDGFVRLAHLRGVRIAVSWFVSPEFWRPEMLLPRSPEVFSRAVQQTDAVISVSQCTTDQFREIYGVRGKVHIVPYHNLPLFSGIVPLPASPPWVIGYAGRMEKEQKNLVTLLAAMQRVLRIRSDVRLELFGGGPDEEFLRKMAVEMGLHHAVHFHGVYDHRTDLDRIIRTCHAFILPSRHEGGPCFALLEAMQAGRFCIATATGGVPDLYEGRPEIGRLLRVADENEISDSILMTVSQLESGEHSAEAIRRRYQEGFDMSAAHNAWRQALVV